MTNSLVQVLCNASLQHYGGDLYVGVMTVINSIREVVSMPVQGITNGCQPVLGYNYGAGSTRRVRRGIRFTTVLTVGYSVAAWALVMAVPELLIRIFNDEPELIAAGIPAFRLYFAAFFCMSFQFIGQSVFVGLGALQERGVFLPAAQGLHCGPADAPAAGAGHGGGRGFRGGAGLQRARRAGLPAHHVYHGLPASGPVRPGADFPRGKFRPLFLPGLRYFPPPAGILSERPFKRRPQGREYP